VSTSYLPKSNWKLDVLPITVDEVQSDCDEVVLPIEHSIEFNQVSCILSQDFSISRRSRMGFALA
jgi:hypothetical protein